MSKTQETQTPPPKLWMHNVLGALVVTTVCCILAALYYNDTTKLIATTYLKLYIGFTFFGIGWLKIGINNKRSMRDWDDIFAKCEAIKSMSTMHGLHGGEILQYNVCVAISQNVMIMHNWFGKAFDTQTGNDAAAALIVQSWIGIPTFFKWNFFPLGYAKLKRMEFEGKESVSMQYQLVPVIDHMREYIDEEGKKCWLGIMVVYGYKLMYFKLYQ